MKYKQNDFLKFEMAHDHSLSLGDCVSHKLQILTSEQHTLAVYDLNNYQVALR